MKKGFTLAELLVSISIIVILSSVGVQSFVATRERAKLEEDVSKIVQAIRKAQNSALATSKSKTIGTDSTDKLCSIGISITKIDKKIQPVYTTVDSSLDSCNSALNNYDSFNNINYADINNDVDIIFDIPFADTVEKQVRLTLGTMSKTITVTNTGLIKIE